MKKQGNAHRSVSVGSRKLSLSSETMRLLTTKDLNVVSGGDGGGTELTRVVPPPGAVHQPTCN